ncbi:MAG: hypothetical protein GTO40_17875 [Deltaproteobacteria bacterium]|nr:hypothetical protein [Deltaproteobacteria bacterium]
MFTKIRHVAIHTENYDRMAKFYQTIFQMKKITTGMTDETGAYNPNRGHISDGVIGLALLQRMPGSGAGLDHFGLEVEDVETVLERLKESYPEIYVAKSPGHVPFAGLRSHDPAGNQFDLSQKGMVNVREGYTEKSWDQQRHLDHIAIRAAKPSVLARFYQRVYGLSLIEDVSDQENFCLTDGTVSLVIRPWNMDTYRGMKEGLDHIGFKVENLDGAKREMEELAVSSPGSGPRKIGLGKVGERKQRNLEACPMGHFATSDPDGIFLDLTD